MSRKGATDGGAAREIENDNGQGSKWPSRSLNPARVDVVDAHVDDEPSGKARFPSPIIKNALNLGSMGDLA
jgi:hypothetical protein